MYHLKITDQPKRRHVKYGAIEKIVGKNKIYNTSKELYSDYSSFYAAFDDLEKLEIKLTEWPGKKPRPYPNIIRIDFFCYGIDKTVEDILISEKVQYKTKPIEIVNESDVSYKAVYFPEMPLLNLEASNAEIKNGRTITKDESYFNTLYSPLIFTDKLAEVRGIVRIKELHNSLVCNDNIKEIFDKNKIVGVYFEEIDSVEELKKYYWSAACAYIGKIGEGNHLQANNQYKILQYLYARFMSNDEREHAMKELMHHWRPPVQLLAATQLLPIYTEESIKVLDTLANNNDIVGTTAKTTLVKWQKGSLKADWLHSLLIKFSDQVTFKSITKTKTEIKN